MVTKIVIFLVFIALLYSTNAGEPILSKTIKPTPVSEYVTTTSLKRNRYSRGAERSTELPQRSLDDDHKGCGWIDIPKTQNGSQSNTKVRKLPWQVSLYWVTTDGIGEIHDNCGGTLIHPRVVLTQPKFHNENLNPNVHRLRVKAGDWNLPSETFVPQSSYVESVAKIETRWFDVNLLFLATPIEQSEHVNYACLPSPSMVTEVPTNCLVEADHNYMGLAHQKTTKMLEVSTMDLEECRRKIRESQYLWTDVKLNSSWICVSNIQGHQNPCEGADGTSLVCPYKNTPGRYYHAGVMSWYSSCYFGEGYGLFKTVAHAKNAIDMKMIERGYNPSTYTPSPRVPV